MTTTSALSVSDQVLARLKTLTNVNVFDGQVDLPTFDPDDETTNRFWDLDDAGNVENVHAYAVLYPGAGLAESRGLDQDPDTLAWTGQVTCVGGDRTRALWCVGRVRSVLGGFRVTSVSGDAVPLFETGDPGPLRLDRDVNPHRHYLPLLFAATA